MGDLAAVLGTSTPFLSAVENGKKNIPADWAAKITAHYNLAEEEQKELEQAIDESKPQYKLNMNKAGSIQRRAAYQFARSFDDMDDETAEKILKLLSKRGADGK